MKLNLLPTYVSKGNQAKTATVVSVLIALIGILGAVGMIFISKDALSKARDDAASKQQRAADAVAKSKQADSVVADAQMIIRNINLADAMLKHNDAYPDLYRDVKPYIPGFYRISNMSATPLDATTTQLNLTGTLKTFQQYADLMIALYRIPGATSVSRTGYVNVDPYIPNITDVDQNGRPIKPGETNVPDNKYDRLAYLQAKGTLTGYTGQGGFGTADNVTPRGAMPGYSVVTVAVVIPRNVQTPDPAATLAQQTGGGGTTGGTGGPGLPGGGPAIPGGGPGGAGPGVGRGD
jgi:hypothetical protein